MPNFSTLLTKHNITAVAIGHFDGIHLGHKELIKRLGRSGALVVIDMNRANLTPGLKRAEYSDCPCFLYNFNDIKNLTGDEFVRLLKSDFVNLKKIVVGYDFAFGRDRAWQNQDLKRLFDGEVVVVDEFCIDGVGVHSSVIREFLAKGEIERANCFIGREYLVEGEVISGQGLGSKELVATLNLDIKDYILPLSGVYATRTCVFNEIFNSVTFIGNRLSTDMKFSVETHILDAKNIDAQTASIYFVKRLRDNKKFDNLSELKSQINSDISLTKELLVQSKC